MHRQVLTTGSLRQLFPEEYAALESSSDLVVSCAQHFSWAGGYGQLFGGVGLLQKLPYRTYVGIKRTHTKRVEYKQARVFSTVANAFCSIPLGHFLDTDITGIFLRHVAPLFPDPEAWDGYEISLLSEAEWTDVVPCFVALASAIALLSGLLSPDFFRPFSSKDAGSYLQKTETRDGITLLWRIAGILENNYTYTPSIPEVATALLGARLPLVTQSADMTDFLTPMGTFHIPPRVLAQMDPPSWYIHPFDDDSPHHQPMPVEWGMVTTGAHRMRSMHFPYTKAMPDFGDLAGLAAHLAGPVVPSDKSSHDPDWFRRKIDVLHFYTMAVVDTFKRSLTTMDANPFLHALHAMHEISHLLQHHELDHVTAPGSEPFKNFLKKHLRGNYAYLVTEKGMRGLSKIFFAAPRHVLSGHEEELGGLYPKAEGQAFSYLSWRDNFGSSGLTVDYARPLLLVNPVQSDLTDLSHVQLDLLVDCTRKKIILGGKQLTSNDLRSQHFTCLLLHALWKSPAKSVLLDDLPRVSYTDSPGELLTKVLSPLDRAARVYTGKPFPLHLEETEQGTRVVVGDLTLRVGFSHEQRPRAQCHKTAEVQPHLLAS